MSNNPYIKKYGPHLASLNSVVNDTYTYVGSNIQSTYIRKQDEISGGLSVARKKRLGLIFSSVASGLFLLSILGTFLFVSVADFADRLDIYVYGVDTSGWTIPAFLTLISLYTFGGAFIFSSNATMQAFSFATFFNVVFFLAIVVTLVKNFLESKGILTMSGLSNKISAVLRLGLLLIIVLPILNIILAELQGATFAAYFASLVFFSLIAAPAVVGLRIGMIYVDEKLFKN
ncbi:MAG: hypothetical protein FWB72_05640 [Firmicutes bacterium]|nr:hypothetical protein [Bacillota bacterium]